MADFNLIMPKMGESIMEATILRWLKKPGDMVALDETILEIATDKVDSEIPSPVAGKLEKILFAENAVVPVGQTIAVISTEAKAGATKSNGTPPPVVQTPQPPTPPKAEPIIAKETPPPPPKPQPSVPYVPASNPVAVSTLTSNSSGRLYYTIVRNIAL
jgi:2-oxoglutarate dehydrogenase E2 component (dihydrolipoamide succinyltransferase)